MPEYEELKNLRERVATRGNFVQNRKDYLASLEESKEEIEAHRLDIEKMRNGLPEDPETSYLLELAQDAVYKEGIILKKIGGVSTSIVKREGSRELKETAVSIEIRSSYENFLNLLNRFEKSARLIEIDNISFSVAEEEGISSSLLDFEIALKTYSLSTERDKD